MKEESHFSLPIAETPRKTTGKEPRMKAEFLETALAIGQRLARQALWDGKLCTWQVQDQVRALQKRVTNRAGPILYQGTAGIAWFLGELYRITNDLEVARAARGGLEHALAQGAELPPLFGFHTGRVGIAWVAIRLSELFQRPEYGYQARRLLRPLVGQEARDQGLDVIDGAGGAIPAFLDLAIKTGWDELWESARGLGEQLIHQAQREPAGWAWRTMIGVVRNLTGMAHGASGMGLALLELAWATGDGRFRFGAEMAFLYERRFFDEKASNWPDLRNMGILNQLHSEQLDQLRQAVMEQTLPPYEPRYVSAWCYGSPGIGLSRLRAWELTGQEVYRHEVEAALSSTVAAIEQDVSGASNYSLCHGIAGNCELLLQAAKFLGKLELRHLVERVAVQGLETYENSGKPWPCGTQGQVADPSLLLGEAGIGVFFLRLADPETPTILLLRPQTAEVATEPSGFEELARESVHEFFGTTLRVCTRLAPPGPNLPSWQPGKDPLLRTPVEETHDVLVSYLKEGAGDCREMLKTAFEPERVRHQLTLEFQDFTQLYLRILVRQAWEELDTEEVAFTLPPGARLVSTNHDWEAWLGTSKKEPPPESDVSFLCHQYNTKIECKRVGPMVSLILEVVSERATLKEVVARVTEAAGIEDPGEELVAKIRTQLRELYLADFIEARPMA